ncbi:MAG: uncharacterized protein JWN31_71 [Frankiales bacterium]|nr:uncharacterized protein [Frankiales bacterium]
MAGVQQLSLAQARRIALAAQGFNDPLPTGAVTARHLRRVVGRTRVLQIDSVNTFARAHHMPAFSRIGPWPTATLDVLAYKKRELFEYWGHEASYLPIELHPLFRWKMARASAADSAWGRAFTAREDLTKRLLTRLEAEGPCGAGALREAPRNKGSWWDWDDVKVGLEYLFVTGQVSVARRTAGFERLYDLTERVIPKAVLDLPDVPQADARRELIRIAATAHGIGTVKDLCDYFRLLPRDTKPMLHDLVDEGFLQPVKVMGWSDTAYVAAGAATPRRVRRSALLSPFDPLVWRRDRTLDLWNVDYRIEIYVPAPKRVYGYYCLLFLHDEAIRARVDLKSDRKAGVLRVMAAWREPEGIHADTASALADQLRLAAQWQGLDDVVVEDRGDLASDLRKAL